MPWVPLLVVAWLLTPAHAPAVSQSPSDAIRDAIIGAVTARVATAQVSVALIDAPNSIALPLLAAVPVAGARFGEPSRFVLTPPTGTRISVVARVDASGRRAIARHAISRSTPLSLEAVEVSEGSLDGLPIASSPSLVQTAEGEVRRNVAAGEILTTALVRLPPAIRAGDEIAVIVRHGSVEARGVGRAASSGAVGDIIRVLAPGRRQTVRARIIAPALVEILQ
jgi:flagella basal body P-ring formation protein FlgA